MAKKKELKAGQLKLVEILANPATANMPIDEVAEECGVSRQTIWKWKKDEQIWDRVYQLAYEMLNKNVPQVYGALSKKAIAGNTKAIELYLKFLGMYVERTETKVEANVDFSDVSDKELEKAIAEYERLAKLEEAEAKKEAGSDD